MKLDFQHMVSNWYCGSVSVPLRGFGYETAVQLWLQDQFARLRVSVPLRGFGYETADSPAGQLLINYYASFRPLAGIWL